MDKYIPQGVVGCESEYFEVPWKTNSSEDLGLGTDVE